MRVPRSCPIPHHGHATQPWLLCRKCVISRVGRILSLSWTSPSLSAESRSCKAQWASWPGGPSERVEDIPSEKSVCGSVVWEFHMGSRDREEMESAVACCVGGLPDLAHAFFSHHQWPTLPRWWFSNRSTHHQQTETWCRGPPHLAWSTDHTET